jgi:hypothetical protein
MEETNAGCVCYRAINDASISHTVIQRPIVIDVE